MKIRIIFAGLCLLQASPSFSQATTSYTYDALGRVVVITDGVTGSTDKDTTIFYDPAGNRSNYRVADAGQPAADPVPTNPTFTLNSNQSTSFSLASLATTTAPALIVSFTPASGGGTASIPSGGQSVSYTAPYVPTSPPCEPAITMTYTASYSVRNQAGGPTMNGTATIRVRGAAGVLGPNQQCN